MLVQLKLGIERRIDKMFDKSNQKKRKTKFARSSGIRDKLFDSKFPQNQSCKQNVCDKSFVGMLSQLKLHHL
jgi:hypothetical protein